MEARGRPVITFLIVPLIFFIAGAGAGAGADSSASTALSTASSSSWKSYVKTSCRKTTYPSLCYRSLSSYSSAIKSDPWRMCSTALSVSLGYARKAKSAFSAMMTTKSGQLSKGDKAVLKQCRDTLGDSIDQLRQSVNIMSDIVKGKAKAKASVWNMELKMSTVKTYVSGAITDEGTCTDGVGEEPVSAALKKNIIQWETAVERLTSNALALINTLNY